MENKNTIIEAKIGDLNELTKVLSVKEQAQEQLLVVIKALGIGKIVRNLKFEKAQGYTLLPIHHAPHRALAGKRRLPTPRPIISMNLTLCQRTRCIDYSNN